MRSGRARRSSRSPAARLAGPRVTSRASRRSSKSGTKEDAVTEPRITIIDVARAASVHPSTVSRVLNGRVELSLLPETRERVIAAAARLGYRPSALARGLRLRRTFTVGMLVPDITNPVFPAIIKGVEGAAHARGYHLILCNTDDSFEREASYLRVLKEWRPERIHHAPPAPPGPPRPQPPPPDGPSP